MSKYAHFRYRYDRFARYGYGTAATGTQVRVRWTGSRPHSPKARGLCYVPINLLERMALQFFFKGALDSVQGFVYSAVDLFTHRAGGVVMFMEAKEGVVALCFYGFIDVEKGDRR